MQIGDVLKAHRELRGLTQQRVADRLQTTRDTVARWERNDHRPRPHHMIELSKLYDQQRDLMWPVDPEMARRLISARRRELLAEQPALVVVEPDPFSWRMRQVTGWRDLDPSTLARRLGVTSKTVARWLVGETTPDWDMLWAIADLLDVPVWWLRCGGVEEQAMYGPYEACAEDTGHPPSLQHGWDFAERTAIEHGIPIDDVVRTAYPKWMGWRWKGRLDEWARPQVPPCPITPRLQLAALAWCGEHGALIEDAHTWLHDLTDMSELSVRRWLDGERIPRWREASLAAAALEIPVWHLWIPGVAAPVLPRR
ncbi:helix-turn-helix transcriptional regulator [Baekduia sp. Peel2402]|uniref:helix-turn-helix transcriptional regulator n=1 Tax=Baekduia sp. Peel2402 TaxID=3458296 RepID=UPI00403ED889